jgi:hypothetical protein
MWFNIPQPRDGDTASGNARRAAAYTSGVHMQPKRLGEADAYAVDLFLDKTATVGQTMMYAAPGNDGMDKRVRAVESILGVLRQMPAEDPPADLAARTLQRIQQRAYQAPAVPGPHPAIHVNPRPHS